MTTIFAQTIARAISDYRLFLRKYLSQSDRVQKLNELKLKDPELYQSEVTMFEMGWRIVKDIEENIEIPEQNYYSYSGIAKFCEFLREYLENYEVEDDKVIHKAQKASRAMIQAIQLISLSGYQYTDSFAQKINSWNEVVALYGSQDQHQLYLSTLEQHRKNNETFYVRVIDNFKQHLQSKVDTQRVKEAV